MNHLRDHIDDARGPGLPPEVEAALAHENADERALLAETWDLAAHYLAPEPDDAVFQRMGAEVWGNLKAALEQEQAVHEQPAPAPLRLVRAPLRLVHPHTMRWAALAASLALLLSVGLLLRQQPVTVTAPYGQVAVHDLPDGSQITLNSGTQISYTRNFGDANRRVTLEGEAFFEVTPGQQPFIVETFDGAVTVLGTQFNVRAWPDDIASATEVAVVSGTVRLTARSGVDRALTLRAGQAARLSERPERVQDPATVDYALAWRDGGFKFPDHPLGTVLHEIERRYDVRVQATPPSLMQAPVGLLKDNSLGAEEILRDICEYNGYQYRAIPGGYEIYQPGAE